MEEKKKTKLCKSLILLLVAVAMIFVVKAKIGGDYQCLCSVQPPPFSYDLGRKWDDIESEIKRKF